MQAAGVALDERTILLDNKVHGGTAGYYVLTPIRLADGGAIVVVNRGWIAQGASRTLRPPILRCAAPCRSRASRKPGRLARSS